MFRYAQSIPERMWCSRLSRNLAGIVLDSFDLLLIHYAFLNLVALRRRPYRTLKQTGVSMSQ